MDTIAGFSTKWCATLKKHTFLLNSEKMNLTCLKIVIFHINYITDEKIFIQMITILIHGGPVNQEKLMSFRQFTSITGCVRSFLLEQKDILRFLTVDQNWISCLNNI